MSTLQPAMSIQRVPVKRNLDSTAKTLDDAKRLIREATVLDNKINLRHSLLAPASWSQSLYSLARVDALEYAL